MEQRWQHTLVGKIIGDPPSFNSLKTFATYVWKNFGPISVSTAEDGFALLKFQDENSCNSVLKQPWHFNHKPMILRKWLLGSLLSELFSESLELWVKFVGIPVGLISGEGLSYIVSSVGVPIYVDTQPIEEGRLDLSMF